eukprot:4836295-Prymnesium_polylepis.1
MTTPPSPMKSALPALGVPPSLLPSGSMVQSVSVSSPPSALTLPRIITLEMCTGAAPGRSVMNDRCKASADRCADSSTAPGSPIIHTCERSQGTYFSGRCA